MIKKLLIFLGVFCSLIVLSSVSTASQKQRRILLINSYHLGLSWTDSITKNIAQTLEKEEVEFCVEYLDGKRRIFSKYEPEFMNYILSKYKLFSPDLIITSDNLAFEFSLRLRERFSKIPPIVFCGINNFTDSLIAGKANITGVAEISSPGETLRKALQFHPQTKVVYVISDGTETGMAESMFARKEFNTFEGIEFRWLIDFSTERLLDTLQTLKPNSLVLLILFNRDSEGKYFSYEESASLITSNVNLPVYGLWDFYINHGIVGGKLVNGAMQGKLAAQLAKRVLSGEDAGNIPVIRDQANRWIFDYSQLVRWNISENQLPNGSLLANKPISWLVKNRRLVITVLSVMILEALLIGILLALFLISRRKAIQKIRQSEAMYRMIYNFAPIGMFQFQSNGDITLCNENFVQILGNKVSNISFLFKGQNFLSPTAKTIEKEFLDPDSGQSKVLRIVTSMIDPEKHLWVGLLEDITEMRLAQKRLMESEQRYKAIFNNTHTPVILVNPQTLFLQSANQAACEFYRWKSEDVRSKKLVDLIDITEERARQMVDKILRDKKSYFIGRNTSLFDEKLRHLELYTGEIVINGQSLIYIMLHDITSRIEAETKNFQNIARLRALEQIFEQYTHPLEEIWEFSLGKALELSHSEKGFIAVMNLGSEEFSLKTQIGHHTDLNYFSDLLSVISTVAEQQSPLIVNNSIQRKISLAKEGVGLFLGERFVIVPVLFHTRDTAIVCVENKPVDYTEVDVEQLLLLMRAVWNVTQRKEAEAMLKWQNTQLEETLRQRDKLISIISHDVKNPFTTLLGLSDLLLRKMENQPLDKTRHMISIMHDSLLDVVVIFENLLEWAKIKSNEKILKIDKIQLNSFIRQIIEQQRTFAELKNISLIYFAAEDLSVKADENALAMILRNLVSNAIKYSPAGSVVEIKTFKGHNGCNVISVIDHGIGIPEEVQSTLFKFSESVVRKGTSGEKGTGIGLSLSYDFAVMMNGSIEVESKPEVGSTFSLLIPAAE